MREETTRSCETVGELPEYGAIIVIIIGLTALLGSWFSSEAFAS